MKKDKSFEKNKSNIKTGGKKPPKKIQHFDILQGGTTNFKINLQYKLKEIKSKQQQQKSAISNLIILVNMT